MAVFILPLLAWFLLSWYENKIESLPVLGKSKEHRIAGFSFINQDGQQKTLANWENKIVVADFFFTHCPVVCPKMTRSLKKIEQQFSNNDALHIASFTVDPARDDANRLKEYANQFEINNHRWDLLTGDKKELYKLARNSFMVVATDGDGGPDDFIHSDKLVLIDTKKRIRGYYNGTDEKEVEQLITDIKKLKHEN